MSWFNNISGNLGNLSQIASNVTNFTKEVLQDAATESFDDIHTESEYQQNALNNLHGHETHDELIQKITYFQNEIVTLRNDVTFKDEQIAFLQDENQACQQLESHVENLKAVLLEKEKEIEVVVQRLHEKDAIHQEQIYKLNETIRDLEARLSQQDIQQQLPTQTPSPQQQQNDSTDSWADDWSLANNSQDINDLMFKIESLSNDLAMKEVVINSIEAKMSQISNSEMSATNFSEWIDVILHEKQVSEDKFKQISNILEDKMNLENHWNGLCSVIEKYSSVTRTDENNDNYIYHVDKWLNDKYSNDTIERNINNDCTNSENELKNYKSIIANIENSISKYSEGYNDFKITEFNEWLDNVGADNFIYYNDDSKNMLERIQEEIREFDDEDSSFRIENFSIWLEKVQCKIDDLEIELINEQETRDTEEKQRILERETLNELFNQKQKEISLLKVELYHKQSSSSSHSLNPIMEVDQEDLSTIHEQLNEANTRCEALQEELVMVQNKSPDTSELQQQINQLSSECLLTKEQLNATEERHQQLVAELNEKYNAASNTSKELELQVNNLSAMNDCIKEQLVTSESTKDAMQSELNDYRIKYDSISAEFEHVNDELKQATSRYELLQAAETVSDSLQLQLNDLSSDKEQLKEKLEISEASKDTVLSELVELKETYSAKCNELDECVEFQRQMESKMTHLREQLDETVEKVQFQQEQLDVLTFNKEELIRTRDEVTLELEEYKFNYKKVCDELSDVKSRANESLQSNQMIDNELQDTKTEFNLLKLLQLQTEEEKNNLQSVYNDLEKAHNELSVNYTKVCDEHKQLSENNMSSQSSVENELNNLRCELQKKVEQLQTLEDNKLNLQLGYDSDLGLMMNVLTGLMNNRLQSSDLETTLACRTSTPLFEVIKALSERYLDLQKQSTELNEQVKTELQEKDLKLGEQNELHNILVFVVKSLDELLPADKKTNLIKDGDKLSTTDLSKYTSQITHLSEYIRDTSENTKKECNEKLDEATRTLAAEKSSNADLLSQIDELNACILNDKARIEQLQSEFNTEELETALEMERVANRKYQSDIEGLHASLNDYKKTVERLKADVGKSAPDTGSGAGAKGGMKFGALKKKLQELETQNDTLIKEVEALKSGGAVLNGNSNNNNSDEIKQLKLMLSDKQQECECYEQECKMLKTSIREMQQESMQHQRASTPDASMISQQHQEQLHSLSLMLTEKNEEIDRFREETEQLKSKLLEVENETSDLELIREECKQLKAMLVGKEHQNKIDDTITTLQSESKQLKQLLASKDSELQFMQNMVLEKENELSNMELIREECKQLKQMLIENGPNSPSSFNESAAELEAKNAEIIELRNSTSDMELLREECKQLKQMLLNNSKVETPTDDSTNVSSQLLEAMLEERDVQITQQNAVIADLQNKTSDLALLREECQHLKTMLASGSPSEGVSSPSQAINSSTGEFFENSFALQVQQLEEFVKEKDEELKNKTQEIEFLTAKLVEKENAISDFDLIQNECKVLKDMLKEKEQLFIELQDDFDSANDVLQSKNEEFKTKEAEYEAKLQESFNYINAKDLEISRLNEEVTENMAQDENLHILQTEYRNVEENLKTTQHELSEVKQLLEERDLEFIDMKRTLTVSENECERLRLYADQHAQMNITLQEKMEEVSSAKLEVESLRTERDSLLNNSNERESSAKSLEEKLHSVTQELQETRENATKFQNDLNRKEASLNEANSTVKNQVDEINKLMVSIDNYSKEIRDKNNKIAQLESELLRSKEHQDSLLESIKMYSSKEQELSACKNCEHAEKERHMINGIIDNIKNILLTVNIQTDNRSESIIEQLSFIESSIPTLIEKMRERDNEITNLTNAYSEMKLGFEQSLQEKTIEIDQLKNMLEESTSLLHTQKNSYDQKIIESQNELKNSNEQTLNDKLIEINSLKSKLDENTTNFNSQKETYELKIQDLQSQLIEMGDIQVLYQNKCGEYLQLQDEYLQEQKKYKDSLSSNQISANSRINEELECLRKELERNSHLYLNKNKECDTLKLEVLQLEETVHNLNMSLQQLKGFEETANSIPTLQLTISNKDEEINILKSTIEDQEQKLEGSKKQKEILDELLRSKGQLEKEKEELLFQNEQKDRLMQEKEVAIKHKDVTIREMESKTKRELERLRGHMIMTEESHTKDILELQEKEDALQQELEEAKQGLSKKSIILQDSSKQFQEHCIDLEVQLQSISSQRDEGVMELSKCHERMQADASAIYNLQNALEQLEKEKTEQSEYLVSMSKRKEHEHVSRIEELTEELNKTQDAMSEAALAVQGINKLNLELTQKENELKVCKEKMGELVGHLHTLEEERNKILEAADHKLDKSLLRNLFMKYFQAPNDKRSDILHVIGGLLGWSPQEIAQLGSGAAPSKVGGWINSVWSYGSGPKKSPPTPKANTPVYDANKSLSELFVKFLEDETAKEAPVDTTSLTLNTDVNPNLQMFITPTPPDILAFHNNSATTPTDGRIPAPGQEIARVHTHHAQSTLKSILTSGPY